MTRFILILYLSFVSSAWAVCGGSSPNLTAASAAESDVSDCVTASVNGDTITVPSGLVTWTSLLSITDKYITIQGAGIDVTTVTRNTTGSDATQLISQTSTIANPSLHFTLSGFTFKTVNKALAGIVAFTNSAYIATGLTPQFRLTNCKITFTPTNASGGTGTRGVEINGAYGLIDNCHFITTDNTGGQMVTVQYNGYHSGVITWFTPQVWGDINQVYMEQNNFDGAAPNDGAFDTYDGQRVTFRHNTVRNTSAGGHGYDSSAGSPRSFEIYSNTFTTDSGVTNIPIMLCRGGTMVVYSNAYDTGYNGIQIRVARAETPHSPLTPRPIAPNSSWGSISSGPDLIAWTGDPTNGFEATGSALVDGNFGGIYPLGYPLYCQPGRGSFPSTNTGSWPTVSTGYASADYQVLDPIYVWDNHQGASLANTVTVFPTGGANWAVSGRDYINNNTSKPGYSALAYPHPLQGASPTPTPTPTPTLTPSTGKGRIIVRRRRP